MPRLILKRIVNYGDLPEPFYENEAEVFIRINGERHPFGEGSWALSENSTLNLEGLIPHFTFPYDGRVEVEIFDKDSCSDDEMGKVTIDASRAGESSAELNVNGYSKLFYEVHLEKNSIKSFMKSISNKIKDHLELSDMTIKKVSANYESSSPASKGYQEKTINLPIKQGEGHSETGKMTTVFHTLNFNAEIISPDTGDWVIDIKDGNDTVYHGEKIKPHEAVNFSYKTGWSMNLDVNAKWSEVKDTNLQINLKVNY